MHWNLPSNPIDLEQREGRINRYKCLAIRQDIAERFADRRFDQDVWQELFSMAAEEIRSVDQSDLVPYWCLGKEQKVKIERIIPMYPVSKDEVNYQRLIKVLSLYRLTMGQARQEELVDYILKSGMKDRDYINSLFINLSPYVRTDEAWKNRMRERQPIVVAKKKTERQMRIEALEKEIQNCEEKMLSLKAEKKTLKSYDIIGMIVIHKQYGEGLATKTDTGHITIEYDDIGEKKYQLPQAFEKGYLVSEYPDFLESFKKNKEIHDEIEILSKQIEEKKEQLFNLKI